MIKSQQDYKKYNQTQSNLIRIVIMMGQGQESNKKNSQQAFDLLKEGSIGEYFASKYQMKMSSDFYNTFSVIKSNDQDKLMIKSIFEEIKQKHNFHIKFPIDQQMSRSIASLLGLAICDALGACTEFETFVKEGYGYIKDGFADVKKAIQKGRLEERAGKVGIWTDDCSMALCQADSLLLNNYEFRPKHMRYLFIVWFFNGLNNGGRKHSIGLGGNIKISMEEFANVQSDFAQTGDRFNNGNGSLMRLAPIPIAFRDNEEKAMKIAGLSSLTTHNGEEAEECCRLLAKILVNLYNRKGNQDPMKVLEHSCETFVTKCKSVEYLAKSQQESDQYYSETCFKSNKMFRFYNKSVKDRNWNWKDKEFTYSQTRFDDKPGYIGSYCMDALAMALHTVWHTKSFKDVAVWNANMGGDCDTVGAIAGQIAGAIYGITPEMLKLYSEMDDFTLGKYEVFTKAYKLAARNSL